MSLCFGSPGYYEGVGFARASPNITVGVRERGHLQRIRVEYFEYYNTARPHQSLDRNSPVPREVEPPANGRVVATPYLGGLHHRYGRAA